ncbi:MAG: hypothetical protein ABSA91_10345, partial [Acidimicrobiales bacterium]
ADTGMGVLSTSDVVRHYADDYKNYHQPDRDARLKSDLTAVIKAVAQAIFTAISHAKQKAGGAPKDKGPIAEGQPRETTTVRGSETTSTAQATPQVEGSGQLDAPPASSHDAKAAPPLHAGPPPTPATHTGTAEARATTSHTGVEPASVHQTPHRQSQTVAQALSPATNGSEPLGRANPVKAVPSSGHTGPSSHPGANAGEPDVGLSDRGVRPGPGERSETREEYRRRTSEERLRAGIAKDAPAIIDALDPENIEVDRVTGKKHPRIEDTAVPGRPPRRMDIEDISRLPGETQREALARVKTVIGHKISEFQALEHLWNEAKSMVLSKNTLTSENYVELFDKTREAFYRRVRGDPGALDIFAHAGLAPTGKDASSAPTLQGTAGGQRVEDLRLSLDHVQEKAQADNWQRALDADNLKFEFASPNTERENSQMRHPELRP